MQYLQFTDGLKKGEKYILTGIIMTFLLGAFGDLVPLVGLLLMLTGELMLIKNTGLRELINTPLTKPFLILILIAVLSLIKITNLTAAGSMIGTLLEIILSFFASYYIFRDKSDYFRNKMLIILFTGGVIAGLFGVYEKIFLGSRRLYLVANSNLLGIYMLFLFFLALTLVFQKDLKYKISGIFLSSLFAFNLIYSLSRSAFLGAITGLLFFFSFKSKKILIVFLIIIILLPLIIPASLTERFKHAYQSLITGDYEQRIYIWQSAYEMFKENPIIGVGVGHFPEEYKNYLSPEAPIQKRRFNHAHNIFIQIMSELGLLGLLTFIFLLITIVKIFYNSLPFANDFKGDLSLSFSAAFAGFFVQELFEFSLTSSAMTVLICILLGWYLVLINKDQI